MASLFGFDYSPPKSPGIQSEDWVTQKIEAYFGECFSQGKNPNIIGFQVALGLLDVPDLIKAAKKSVAIQRGLKRLESVYAEALLSRYALGAQFVLKAVFGWSDKTEIQVTASDDSLKTHLESLTDEELLKMRDALVGGKDG